MNLKLRKWGNSSGIILLQALLVKLGGDIESFDAEVKGGKIILTPVRKDRATDLDDLFKGFDVESYLEDEKLEKEAEEFRLDFTGLDDGSEDGGLSL